MLRDLSVAPLNILDLRGFETRTVVMGVTPEIMRHNAKIKMYLLLFFSLFSVPASIFDCVGFSVSLKAPYSFCGQFVDRTIKRCYPRKSVPELLVGLTY